MSFDISFFLPNASTVNNEVINAYLDAKIPVPEGQVLVEGAWHYGNMHTGVYFSLYRYNAAGTANEPYIGFSEVGICMELNYARPDFFGKEAFIFLKQMTDELGLYIKGKVDYPVPCNATQLFEEWQQLNRQASLQFFDPAVTTYLSPEVSGKVWAFNVTRPLMQKQLGDAYYVPQIMLFKDVNTLAPLRLSAWLAPGAAVFPEADYVVVNRKMETGIIAYDKLMAVLGDYLMRVEGTGAYLLLPSYEQAAAQLVEYLPLDTAFQSRMTLANMMHLYNYKPS